MRKIALIGGDCRQIHAAAAFQKAGFKPYVFGNDSAAKEGFIAPYTLKETLADAEAVLLPVPSIKKKGFLNTPYTEGSISLSSLTEYLSQNTTIFLWGKEDCLLPNRFQVVDLEKDEELIKENAILTAEAALCLAMQTSKRSIGAAKIAVVGYGRIGKALCRMASALGAEVTVVAREGKNKEMARQKGFLNCSPEKTSLFTNTDMIFNTVPAPVLTKSCFEGIPRHLLYFELASYPGGLDPQAVSFLSEKIVQGGGLPGKFFPVDAGALLARAVLGHLEVKT